MRKSGRKEKTLNTKLFVRILPTTDFHYDSIKIETNRQVLYVRCLQDLSKGIKIKNRNYWYFCTDGVFWNSCQSEVYRAVTAGLYEELFDGVRAIIICYGQTGAGKTFTTSGLRYPFQKRGLILRVLSQLFEEKEARRDVTKICLGMSYLEFNGPVIKDLICDRKLSSIKDVAEYKIPDEIWAWTQIFKAETKKSYNESAPYGGSNRGHSVLSLHIHAESLIDSDPIIRHSKIHIVDMGGIDNVGNKQSEWRNKIDVCNSNLSKTLMEQLILYFVGAAWKNEKNVCPYKTNHLLTYLHDTLNDKCLLRFVAHIYGNQENIPITLSTLRFGEKIRSMRPTKLERIYETTRDLELRNLQKDYLRLKNEAELNYLFKEGPTDGNMSQERLQEIKRAAEGFLFGQLEDLTLFSMGQAHITLQVFKDLYHKLSMEKDQIMKDAVSAAREIFQNQIMSERHSVQIGTSSPNNQKMSRKKSRQADSQTSFGMSNKSSDSIQPAGRVSSVVHQVGTTDKRGIGIGPPKKTPSTFEGNVTKAFKKLKSKKSDSIVLKGMKSGTTRDFGVHQSKYQIMDDISKLSVQTEIPPRETAWNIFINYKADVITELNAKAEATDEVAREAKRNYVKTLVELSKIREEMEECKTVLENCRHIRQVNGKVEFDDDNKPIPGEFESNLLQAIAQKERLLNEAIENCHVALIDFRHAAEELQGVRKNLDSAFQEFCVEHYKTTYPSVETPVIQIKSEPLDEKTDDVKNQAIMELYEQLQEKLLNELSKTAKVGKKPWVKLF